MTLEELNFLRWITEGKIEDCILKASYDWEFLDENKFKFKIKGNFNSEDWKVTYGSSI